jgi:hypothetical protein
VAENLAVGDTVTIDGVIFTFSGAPAAGPLQVLADAGGNNAASLTIYRIKLMHIRHLIIE